AAAARGRRYEALDSLRGVAACFVVLYHLHTTGFITNVAIVRHAWLFVDFFFVLSGFVIAASYGEKLKTGFPLRAYMILRLGRIYPLHLFIILVFVAIECALLLAGAQGMQGRAPFTGPRSLPFLADNLLLIQIFVPGAKASWNGVSWSIAAEVWTYALTAAGLVLLGRRFRFVLVAIALLAPLALGWLGDGLLNSRGLTLVRCLYGFSLGMLAFDLSARWRGRGSLGRSAATFAEAGLVLLCGAAIIGVPDSPLEFACPALFALAIIVLAREEGAVADVLKLAPLRRLGDWSYSIYMVHPLVLALIVHPLALAGARLGVPLVEVGTIEGHPARIIGGPAWLPELVVPVVLILVIAASALTYRLIELPCRNASRGWAERIAGRPAAAAERVAPTI
ncbi:MAG TPA: acyltransferase, partial [Allosphingosinicella sp.]|nr:acyltransferase [Allosphingosinicella sp.]